VFSFHFSNKQPFHNPPTEELLIDFRELLGEHSGENMAEAVWATMELYGLVGKVSSGPRFINLTYNVLQIIAIVMDNASNNNTLMTSLERRCEQRGVQFPAQDARMRCMPHTIHLAAIKVPTLYQLLWTKLTFH